MVRRNAKGRLVALLEQSPQPLYALDERRRLVFVNQAAAAWLNAPQDKLIGITCNYHSRSDADLLQRIAACLCPPPDAFHGVNCRGEVGGYLLDPSGESFHSRKWASFWPCATSGESFGVIAIVDSNASPPQQDDLRDGRDPSAEELHRQIAQWRRETSARFRLDRIVGSSSAMRSVQRIAKAAIASGADTTIVGPAGGGMEQLARTIHYSQYATGMSPPLIPLDCAICDAESLHGALRHVQSDRERTTKGRLLLLQADRMNPQLMHELSGFIAISGFDVGLLSTGETSLQSLASRGEFDSALAMHLSTLEITLPSLRERIQDLPLVCQSLVEDFNAEGNRQLAGIHSDAIELLCEYPWPGDWDELVQVVHSACQHATGTLVQVADLPPQIQRGVVASRLPPPVEASIELTTFLRDVENELMRRAIRVSKGNKARAARLLGISRQRMIRWAEQNKND